MSIKKKKVKLKLLRRSCIYVWAKEKGTKRGNKLYDTFLWARSYLHGNLNNITLTSITIFWM